MPLYPETIARCQHIKVNGTQCASPAVHARRFCYFHNQYRQKTLQINSNLQQQRGKVTLPLLEDANSIQMGLVQVMRLLLTQQIDHRTAGVLLYGLQTASANLKHTLFEPEPTRVVVDPKSVARRPLAFPPGPRSKESSTTTCRNASTTRSRKACPNWAKPP